ncbi:hypothetical protein TruAng_011479 [Truncatella angustata]|nr:hypothetical protein TruAng_011479 [Truncatella angustata]
MRLLNAKTLELKEFFGGSIPEYTILSHTWGEEEVTLQEIVERRWWKKRGIKKKAGFKKITGCQRLTRELGLDWFWIDTCCIDKTSSAELSEAVNSMYQWYQRSRKCFAFLSDVSWEDGPVSKNSSFRRSRWFTRGWTLQELLAPTFLEFYDQAWVSLGFRDSQRLTGIIKEITGIGGEILGASFKDQPAATIFSWASRRKTSRQEDMTYCLLGLLNITMPLLYGEGNRAFARLQEERLKQRHDQTLLAWGLDDKLSQFYQRRYLIRSLLAPSPEAYIAWNSNIALDAFRGAHFTSTNMGLMMELYVKVLTEDRSLAIAILDLEDDSDQEIAIPLYIHYREDGLPIARRSYDVTPFRVGRKIPGSMKMSMYLQNGLGNFSILQENWDGTYNFFGEQRTNMNQYVLADYFSYPTTDLVAAGDSWQFRVQEGTQILWRFVHSTKPANPNLLVLYCQDVENLDSSTPVWDGFMAFATGPDFGTSWEIMLQPEFDRPDFEKLKAKMRWTSSVEILIADKLLDFCPKVIHDDRVGIKGREWTWEPLPARAVQI